MTKEATQEGVSEGSETKNEPKNEAPKAPVKSRRDLAYEAIIASREAEKAELPPAEEPPAKPEQPVAEEPPEVETPMLEFMFNGEIIKVPATAKYRAKIDGEEVEVDVDNIARSYQKGAAADRRLEEATRKARRRHHENSHHRRHFRHRPTAGAGLSRRGARGLGAGPQPGKACGP